MKKYILAFLVFSSFFLLVSCFQRVESPFEETNSSENMTQTGSQEQNVEENISSDATGSVNQQVTVQGDNQTDGNIGSENSWDAQNESGWLTQEQQDIIEKGKNDISDAIADDAFEDLFKDLWM